MRNLWFSARSFFRAVVWLGLTGLVVALSSVPTTLSVQVLLGVFVIAVIIVLRSHVHSTGIRLLLMGISSLIVLRYWFWRLLTTLPGLDDPVSYVPALLLFLVETYLIGIFFLGNLMVADPLRHKRPKPMNVGELPKVDVLVPSLDEPRELLAITLAAAKNMSYPEHLLNVVLCDDGGTDARCVDPNPAKAAAALRRRRELQTLCAELGVIYSTRAENRHAKAGNLNEALSLLDGDLVAIFDSDHAPTHDFLARTVGYFAEDPKLFLVQTPHFFLNEDPVARNLKLGNVPAENEMFYGILHEGLDRWGGAFFCGSAAVLRRTALDEAGGISGNTITEDAETALRIHCNGWRSMYLNHAMIAGLQPETFASFLTQRGRWATGMISELFMTRNPFMLRGLKFFQRLCYFNSMSFWVFPIIRMILLMAPLAYLFFGIELFVATAGEAAAYMITYILVMYLMQNTLFGTTRRPFLSEIYEIAQAPYLAKTVIRTMLNPRNASFKVTSKTETVDEAVLSDVYRPLMMLFALMLVGVGVLGYRWTMFPGDRSVLQIVGVWVIFNTLMVGAALRSVVETRQRRLSPRAATAIPAVAWTPDATLDEPDLPARVVNMSYSGALLALLPRPDRRPHRRFAVGDRIQLMPTKDFGFAKAQPVQGQVANVRVGGERLLLGLAFDRKQNEFGYRTIAAMLNGDSNRWQEIRASRARHVGLLTGFVQFLKLAVAGVLATLAAALQFRNRAKVADTAESGWIDDAPIEAQAFQQNVAPPRFVLTREHRFQDPMTTTSA